MIKELKSGIYKHYKGGLYLVLGAARHSETEEKLVVYVPLYTKSGQIGPRITVRPYEMFFDEVMVKGVKFSRFAYVGEEISESDMQVQNPSVK